MNRFCSCCVCFFGCFDSSMQCEANVLRCICWCRRALFRCQRRTSVRWDETFSAAGSPCCKQPEPGDLLTGAAGNSVHGVCMQSSPVERVLRPCVAAHGLESVPAAIHKIWSWARGNVLLLDKLAFLISYSAQFQGYARLRAGLVSTRKPETLNSTKRWKRWMRPRISWAPGI